MVKEWQSRMGLPLEVVSEKLLASVWVSPSRLQSVWLWASP